MKLHLKSGSVWEFIYDSQYDKLVHKAKKHTYALFFDISSGNCDDKGELDIWVGMYAVDYEGRSCWITVENQIRALYLELFRGRFYFGRQ